MRRFPDGVRSNAFANYLYLVIKQIYIARVLYISTSWYGVHTGSLYCQCQCRFAYLLPEKKTPLIILRLEYELFSITYIVHCL